MTIFVVQHGNNEIEIAITDELKTDKYENLQKIFVCENTEEVLFLMEELRNERSS